MALVCNQRHPAFLSYWKIVEFFLLVMSLFFSVDIITFSLYKRSVEKH